MPKPKLPESVWESRRSTWRRLWELGTNATQDEKRERWMLSSLIKRYDRHYEKPRYKRMTPWPPVKGNDGKSMSRTEMRAIAQHRRSGPRLSRSSQKAWETKLDSQDPRDDSVEDRVERIRTRVRRRKRERRSRLRQGSSTTSISPQSETRDHAVSGRTVNSDEESTTVENLSSGVAAEISFALPGHWSPFAATSNALQPPVVQPDVTSSNVSDLEASLANAFKPYIDPSLELYTFSTYSPGEDIFCPDLHMPQYGTWTQGTQGPETASEYERFDPFDRSEMGYSIQHSRYRRYVSAVLLDRHRPAGVGAHGLSRGYEAGPDDSILRIAPLSRSAGAGDGPGRVHVAH